MLYLAVPIGAFHGWGVCGRYLTKELSAPSQVALLTEPFDLHAVGDELDYHLLTRLLCQPEPSGPVPVPVLQAVANTAMLPYRPVLRGALNVGYTFFENNLLTPHQVDNLRRHFDLVVAGSRFCEQVLRGYGLHAVTTVLQGVDSAIFHPALSAKEYFPDRFVVFSGGKFEFRKGQDLVIRAFKVLQDRHPDILTPENAIPLRPARSITLRDGDADVAQWSEPDLEETIARLEWAYQNRDHLAHIAAAAPRDMSALTWKRTAARFHSLLGGPPPPLTGPLSAAPAAGSA